MLGQDRTGFVILGHVRLCNVSIGQVRPSLGNFRPG